MLGDKRCGQSETRRTRSPSCLAKGKEMSESVAEAPASQSLAIHMRDVFARLPANDASLHEAWRAVLNVKGGDAALYDALRLLAHALQRLEAQVTDSRRMSDTSKKIALPIINGLQQCVHTGHLSHPSKAFGRHISGENLDKLTLIADHLGQEFPEPQLSDDDVETIKAALRELDELLAVTDLDSRLKSRLTTHVILMRWALEQHAVIGLDGLYDTLARSYTVFRREASTADRPRHSEGWWKKVQTQLATILATIDKVDRLYRAGKDASEVVAYVKENGLLSFLNGS